MYNVSVVVGMDAEMDDSSADAMIQTEDTIVSQWENLPVSKCDVRELVDKVLRPLGLETTLVVIRRANSLALYFICLSLSALMSLRDQWSNGSLKDIVQSLFTLLSGAGHEVRVKRLSWSQSDYERCVEFFSSVRGELVILAVNFRAALFIITH